MADENTNQPTPPAADAGKPAAPVATLDSYTAMSGADDMADTSADSFEIIDQDQPTPPTPDFDDGNGNQADDDGGDDDGETDGETDGGKGDEADGDGKAAEESDADGELTQEEHDKLPKGIQKRLARARAQREREIARADAAEAELAKIRKAEEEAAAAPAEPPSAADFDDYESYLDAKREYEANKGKKPTKEKDAPAEGELSAADAAELNVAIGSIKTAIEKEHPDLWAKVSDANNTALQITREMVLAISDTDNPEAVLQAFVEKPELSAEIAKLTPSRAAMRIAKLDRPLTGKPTPPKKATSAPEPIDPVSGKSIQAKKLDDMPFNEFEEARSKQEQNSQDFWL